MDALPESLRAPASHIKPDNDAALEFLQRFAPAGPWVLTAISVDRRSVTTNAFAAERRGALLAWLEQFNGQRNIYFAVNPLLQAPNRKATKRDVAAMAWLHVDIDPRAGDDLQAERLRVQEVLTERLPKGVPPPTVVVFSGGGHQAFWRLERPEAVDGDEARAEEAERYNKHLEFLFGADACHNLDRIMRLPGTVNLPDDKKRKKGRVPELARVVAEGTDWTRAYPLADFGKAPPLGTAPSSLSPGQDGAASNPEAHVSPAARLADVGELDQWNVPDRVKVIIVQGRHPDETKKGDNSRSIWLFDAVCNLVRCGVPEDVILSILLDPDFGISESVLESKRPEKYARRQVIRAKAETADANLEELNAQYAVVANIGGKCMVMDFKGGENGSRFSLVSFDSLLRWKANHVIQIGVNAQGAPIRRPVAKWWMEHPQRRQYDRVGFWPKGGGEDGAYNLWQGWGVTPSSGDWSLIRRHIAEVIAAGDAGHADYITRWLAWAVQNPDKPARVALVLRGGQGTGKGMFMQSLARVFGEHFRQITSTRMLSGNFNSHLEDCCLLFADEVSAARDKESVGRIKGLVTEKTLLIERKGVDAYPAPNRLKIVMASNERQAVHADMDDRRFAVFDVSPARVGDSAYWTALDAQIEGGGAAAMLNDLLAMDLDGWLPDVHRPRTQALVEQKETSLAPLDKVMLDFLRVGSLPVGTMRGGSAIVATGELREAIAERARNSWRADLLTDHAVAAFLASLGGKAMRNVGVTRTKRGFAIPPLPEARATWDRTRFPVRWGDETEWVVDTAPNGREPF